MTEPGADKENEVRISVALTPNPDSIKFVVNRALVTQGAVYFENEKSAEESPLVRSLFEIRCLTGVLVGPGFITLTKRPDVSWEPWIPKIFDVLKTRLTEGGVLIHESAAPKPYQEESDPVVSKIRQIIEEEIRPALAMDGGDVVYISFRDGVVSIHLLGACHACPSAGMTLRFGIENRLKQSVPEVQSVVSV